jgi:hypothetical protein
MTVQEICDKLRKYYEDAYKATIQDRATFLVDLFPESLDAEFTKDIILELRGKVHSKDTTMGEAIGIQEALAFIGAAQRQDCCRKESRLQRLQKGYAHRFAMGHVEGPVGLQLNGIGVKTGVEFLDNMEGEA